MKELDVEGRILGLGHVVDFTEILEAGVAEAKSSDTCLLSYHHL